VGRRVVLRNSTSRHVALVVVAVALVAVALVTLSLSPIEQREFAGRQTRSASRTARLTLPIEQREFAGRQTRTASRTARPFLLFLFQQCHAGSAAKFQTRIDRACQTRASNTWDCFYPQFHTMNIINDRQSGEQPSGDPDLHSRPSNMNVTPNQHIVAAISLACMSGDVEFLKSWARADVVEIEIVYNNTSKNRLLSLGPPFAMPYLT
jgi:hypothetical protein